MKKEKLDIAAVKKSFLFCKKYFPGVILTIILALGGSIASLLGPSRVSALMNTITEGIKTSVDMKAFFSIVKSLAIIYGVSLVFNYFHQFVTSTITQKITEDFRRAIDKKLGKLPLRFFDTTSKGEVISKISNDVGTISSNLSSGAANLLSGLVSFVGVFILMFKTNFVLTVVAILSSIVPMIVTVAILPKTQRYFKERQKKIGEMNGQIEEVYTNHAIVRAFGAGEQETGKFNKTNGILYESNWKAEVLTSLIGPLMAFSGTLAYVLIFVVGTLFILKGNSLVNLGTIVEFVIYATMFTTPLTTLASSISSLQQTAAAGGRVFEILDAEETVNEEEKTLTIENVKGNVEFSHVKFGYNPETTVIKDFSAKIAAGQKVAIVGPTGAGKTTLVNLLMRFYEVDEGDIFIDNVSIKDMKRENVHNLFDMILQDTWVFGGSIRENLVFNTKGVTDNDLNRACEAVGLSYFIKTLPNGYDTVLTEALSLSAGQKQQLTIARAILKNSPMLILDEATSSVDTRTEIVIQEAMDKITKNRTSFIIAHRLSTIVNADVILVLKDGDVIETGTHNELLEKKGFYYELYNSQFSGLE